jgi:hypothetical protein
VDVEPARLIAVGGSAVGRVQRHGLIIPVEPSLDVVEQLVPQPEIGVEVEDGD